ncbi:MAG: class I SAM-dependent methyltransferase [Armatimonadota bacterium]|nr:class I SAM-dependent methyltransferase [Armatimonadota bacterium]
MDSAQPDFRLRTEKTVTLPFQVGTPASTEGIDLGALKFHPTPAVDFAGTAVPHHLSKEILSHFPKAGSPDSLVLDIGCGNSIHRGVCERAGFEYAGLDYMEVGAHMFGDAHALPFKDNSFEFILSIAVLEHIQFPFLMMYEAIRVLKPGGKFIGTVAFLEPHHQDSYYHHTHLGTCNSLQYAGFDIEQIAPSVGWSVLRAQAPTLFSKLPRPLSNLIVLPLHLTHRAWWKLGGLVSEKATERNRLLLLTGSFTFIAYKPNV